MSAGVQFCARMRVNASLVRRHGIARNAVRQQHGHETPGTYTERSGRDAAPHNLRQGALDADKSI